MADTKCSRRLHERERKERNGRQRIPYYLVYDADPMVKTKKTSKERTFSRS